MRRNLYRGNIYLLELEANRLNYLFLAYVSHDWLHLLLWEVSVSWHKRVLVYVKTETQEIKPSRLGWIKAIVSDVLRKVLSIH